MGLKVNMYRYDVVAHHHHHYHIPGAVMNEGPELRPSPERNISKAVLPFIDAYTFISKEVINLSGISLVKQRLNEKIRERIRQHLNSFFSF